MPIIKTIDINQATLPLEKYAHGLGGEPLLLTEDNQPVAVLMPIDESDMASLALDENPRFQQILEHSRRQRREGAGLTSDEVRQALRLAAKG